MIDIESQVFERVATAVETECQDLKPIVGDGYTKTPERFPFVGISEVINEVATAFRTTDSIENMVTVVYQIDAYDNNESLKKSRCKRLLAAADLAMSKMGFTRISMVPTPNLMDSTIYRVTARYRAHVDKKERIYNRG